MLGKRVDQIRKILQQAFKKAVLYQPSIILLDDIDCITSLSQDPALEVGEDATYKLRIAESKL